MSEAMLLLVPGERMRLGTPLLSRNGLNPLDLGSGVEWYVGVFLFSFFFF